MPRATPDDVNLILRLYELRRDPELRRARAFMLTEFNPKTWDEVRAHYLTGDEVDRHFRMATSYWEMVAAFVNKGLLDEDLFFDTHGEDMVVWKKVEPIVAGARKSIRPTWLWNLEQVAKRHLAWRQETFKTAGKVIEAGSKLRKKSKAK
jgi:hypothetical protein